MIGWMIDDDDERQKSAGRLMNMKCHGTFSTSTYTRHANIATTSQFPSAMPDILLKETRLDVTFSSSLRISLSLPFLLVHGAKISHPASSTPSIIISRG
jgi:hypothetical protein